MITLEQIRLLESKITRALELIRVLKDENSTLRKGLESAQRRMKELETLVDGFKADQKEIESVIVRTLHNLDDLEESAAAAAAAGGIPAGGIQASATAAAARGEGGIPAAGRGESGLPAAAGGGSSVSPEGRPGASAGTRAPVEPNGQAAGPGGAAGKRAEPRAGGPRPLSSAASPPESDEASPPSKEELDIF